MSGWYVIAPNGEQELGPFTGVQLVALAKSKRISANTLLRNSEVTKDKRIAASNIKQLQAIFTAPAPAELVEEPHPEDAIIESGKKLLSKAAAGVGGALNSMRGMIPAKKETPVTAEAIEPPVMANNSLANFAAEGQDVSMVTKLLERVSQLCMSSEKPLYMAIQQRPIANFSPDAVVLTSHRFIVVQQKILGRMTFADYPWREVRDVHVQENVMSATISFISVNGLRHSVDWLPKEQARKVYRIAQEQEEAMHRARREMMLEEKRAGTSQTNVTTNVVAATPTSTSQPAESDPVAKLQQLKRMLDAELISQAEYDSKKAELLSRM